MGSGTRRQGIEGVAEGGEMEEGDGSVEVEEGEEGLVGEEGEKQVCKTPTREAPVQEGCPLPCALLPLGHSHQRG